MITKFYTSSTKTNVLANAPAAASRTIAQLALRATALKMGTASLVALALGTENISMECVKSFATKSAKAAGTLGLTVLSAQICM